MPGEAACDFQQRALLAGVHRAVCGEHDLLAAYRAMNTRQQGALLEIARGLAGHPARRTTTKPRK